MLILLLVAAAGGFGRYRALMDDLLRYKEDTRNGPAQSKIQKVQTVITFTILLIQGLARGKSWADRYV